MPYTVPLFPSEPNYRVSTILDGETYILDVHWNARDEAWFFSLLSQDETEIISGVKVVLGVLLGPNASALMLSGALLANDRTGSGTDAGLDDLGDRVVVEYWPLAEIEDIP